MQDRDYYFSFRKKYEPEQLKLAIVAESPPASGLYFYDPLGKISEPALRDVCPDHVGANRRRPGPHANRVRTISQ
jgi:hypothetical protein